MSLIECRKSMCLICFALIQSLIGKKEKKKKERKGSHHFLNQLGDLSKERSTHVELVDMIAP